MRTRIASALVAIALVTAASCAPPPAPARVASPVPSPPSPAARPVAPEPEPALEASPTAPPPAPPPAESPPPDAAPAKPRLTITKGTRVLMFGDSMVTSGLGIYLQERVVAHGGKFFSISKGSSTTATWSDSREIERLLALTRPDIVLVVLASNELFVPNPGARRYAIRSIVERLGTRPCLWIGPSPWLPEKGILGVVQGAAAPCRYFDSTPLTLERQADHIHPTLAGGKVWADAVWQDAFAD